MCKFTSKKKCLTHSFYILLVFEEQCVPYLFHTNATHKSINFGRSVVATFGCPLATRGHHMFDLAEFYSGCPSWRHPKGDLCLRLDSNQQPFAGQLNAFTAVFSSLLVSHSKAFFTFIHWAQFAFVLEVSLLLSALCQFASPEYLSGPPKPLQMSLTPVVLQGPEPLQSGLSAVQQHVQCPPDWPWGERRRNKYWGFYLWLQHLIIHHKNKSTHFKDTQIKI